MRTVALLPINALAVAKSRLANTLDAEERRALVLWMAERVLCAIRASGLATRIAVVSPDTAALAWARAEDADAIYQSNVGLNAGLDLGRDWARENGADALLVLFGDLPLVSASDVAALVAHVERSPAARVVALAPDREGRGANGLAMRPLDALPFLFGIESRARFTAAALTAGVEAHMVTLPGTSFDVDTPEHLRELSERGLWAPRGHDARMSLARRTSCE
ncbi:MAG TPA: 2-phospho-L-lactate guanylyltransferase [Ktedonobacterales bacterium]|nr:2-phospho-L-lactate guanylyltransferase [Ktedonobacterales bacterium]